MSEPKKVTNLIEGDGKFKFSFEVTPDINNEDIESLEVEPTFFAVTWHAKSHQCKNLEIAPLRTASFLRNKKKHVVMHLSCDLLRKDYLDKLLAFLQEQGICNLFLVLGESYNPNTSDFNNTLELIKYVRNATGTYFCIGVAGFCESNEEKLKQLKEKIDAGADFIITQALFEADVLKIFKEKCTKNGINVPILPGVFAFENYEQLTNFANMCKVKVSDNLLEYVKNNEGNEIVSVEVIKNIIQTIKSDNSTVNFHFFTLNKLRSVCNAIQQIQ